MRVCGFAVGASASTSSSAVTAQHVVAFDLMWCQHDARSDVGAQMGVTQFALKSGDFIYQFLQTLVTCAGFRKQPIQLLFPIDDLHAEQLGLRLHGVEHRLDLLAL